MHSNVIIAVKWYAYWGASHIAGFCSRLCCPFATVFEIKLSRSVLYFFYLKEEKAFVAFLNSFQFDITLFV